MNITGWFYMRGFYNSSWGPNLNFPGGAFFHRTSDTTGTTITLGTETNDNYVMEFDASKNWTGEISIF